MSMPSLDPEESPADLPEPMTPPDPFAATNEGALAVSSADESVAPRDGWVLVALIPYEGIEPPAGIREDLARAVSCTVSAIWHPSLLGGARELPRIESIESPSPPGPREVRIIAEGAARSVFLLDIERRSRIPGRRCWSREPIAPN